MATVYTTLVDGAEEYVGDSLKEAIQVWDRATYIEGGVGGIAVREWDGNGAMVLDGWILHVRPDGVVYLSTSLG